MLNRSQNLTRSLSQGLTDSEEVSSKETGESGDELSKERKRPVGIPPLDAKV